MRDGEHLAEQDAAHRLGEVAIEAGAVGALAIGLSDSAMYRQRSPAARPVIRNCMPSVVLPTPGSPWTLVDGGDLRRALARTGADLPCGSRI